MIQEIVQHISTHIPTLIIGKTLFANRYPDGDKIANNIVAVIPNGGFSPNRYLPTRDLIYEIKIRNTDYLNGETIGNQIMNLFHAKENYSLDGFFVLESYCYSELSYLYTDAKNREEFSLEIVFKIQK